MIQVPRAVLQQAVKCLASAWLTDPDKEDGYYARSKEALEALLDAPKVEPTCDHERVDDGDNLQILCVKCGKRWDVDFSVAEGIEP